MDKCGNLALMSQMITVKDAAELAEKSVKTIRRWLSEITANSSHPDRSKVLPTVNEERELRLNKGRLIWKIDKRLIEQQFLKQNHSTTSQPKSRVGESELERLRRKLDEAEERLEREREHNRTMQQKSDERQREANVLMRGYQEQLGLAAGDWQASKTAEADNDSSTDIPVDVVEANVVMQTDSHEPTEKETTNEPESTTNTKRRSLRKWIRSGPAIRFDREQKALKFYIANGNNV